MSGSQRSHSRLAADLRLGIDGEVLPPARGGVHPQRTQIPRVEDVVGGHPVQVVGQLGTVGVGEGVDDDVHLVQLGALGRIGEQQLGVAQHMAGGRDLVGVLPGRVDDRGLEGGRLGARPVGGGDGGHQVHRPRRLAEVALADLVHTRAREGLAHPGHHLVTLGRRDGRVPLDDAVAVVGPALRDEVGPYGQRCRGPVAGQDRRHPRGIVLLVGPLGPHADLADLVVGQRSGVQAGIPQRCQIGERGRDLLLPRSCARPPVRASP